MKQPDDMARMQAIVDMADLAGQFIDRLFRKKPIPPPDGWAVEFRFTTLGGIQMWVPTSVPAEVRSTAYKVVSVLAWLYPGPMESKLIRENETLRAVTYSQRRRIYQLEDEQLAGKNDRRQP